MKTKTLFLILMMLSSVLLKSQEQDKLDILHIKGNNLLKGQITDTLAGEGISFRLLSGQELFIPFGDVEKHRKSKKEYVIKPGDYFYLVKGFYFSWGASLNIPLDSRTQVFVEKPKVPVNVHFSGGYRFNNYVSVGLQVETDMKNYQYVPIGLEVKATSLDKNSKPLVVIVTGRNFYFGKRHTPDFYFKPVDFFIFPSFGFIKSKRKMYSTELTVGIKAQLTYLKYKKYGIQPQPVLFDDANIDKVWDQYFIIRMAFTF